MNTLFRLISGHPKDVQDLLNQQPENCQVTVLGITSNTLARTESDRDVTVIIKTEEQ
jgi:hypothetical protein